MRIPPLGRRADFPDYYHASQFLDHSSGRIDAVWSHGIPTILPGCTHVALGFMIPRTPRGLHGDGMWIYQFVPRAHLAAIAASYWRPLEGGLVRLERCPEDEWLRLYQIATPFDVGPPGRAA